jgi:hypothetical protein
MRDDLDEVMARLAAGGVERSLDGFEDAVLRGIAQRREEVRTTQALSSYRVASIGLALAIGVTAGGMAAARTFGQPGQFSPFSTAAHLAPSTLLEGEG